jgi:hypothetical protein
VKNDYGTELTGLDLNGLEEPLEKKLLVSLFRWLDCLLVGLILKSVFLYLLGYPVEHLIKILSDYSV